MTEDAEVPGHVTEAAVAAFVGAMRTLFGALPAGEWSERRPGLLHDAPAAAPLQRPARARPGRRRAGPPGTSTRWPVRGLPYAMLSRPSAPPWVASLAAAYGLTRLRARAVHVPLRPRHARGAAPRRGPGRAHHRRDRPGRRRAGRHRCRCSPTASRPRSGSSRRSSRPEVLALAGVTAYVGRVDGGAVHDRLRRGGRRARRRLQHRHAAGPPATRLWRGGHGAGRRRRGAGGRAHGLPPGEPDGVRRLRADGLPHRRDLALLLPGLTDRADGPERADRGRSHQPRSRHSSRWGRSAPSVESSPWPG